MKDDEQFGDRLTDLTVKLTMFEADIGETLMFWMMRQIAFVTA